MSELSQPRPAPQCTFDHVDAAKTGLLECLRRLQEAGRFLGLHDPERESAGEARKLEIWDAAVAACKAGHAQVLSWLFSGDWPDTIDAAVPWYLSDLAQPRGERDWEELQIPGMPDRNLWFLPELTLCRYAMKITDTSCLEALLNAGCRSEWFCPMAALEGREGHLALAAERGARCDARTMYPAASRGNLRLLQAAHHHATIQAGATSGCPLLDWRELGVLRYCFEDAAENGHADCLGALLSWFPDKSLWEPASEAAGRGGHISCLEELQRRGWEDWKSTAYSAAEAGQIDTLLYLLELRPLQQVLDQDRETGTVLLESAAAGGHLACLEVLTDRGLEWRVSVLTDAIRGGSLECMQYALGHTWGEPLDMLSWVIHWNSPSCLQLLYDRGCLPQSRQFWDGLQEEAPLITLVADLDCLKVMVANSGRPPPHMLLTDIAAKGGLAILQYMHELGALWGPRTMRNASQSVDTMRYAHENGCPWGEAVMSDFIIKVECLQYAHENGCTYDVPARSTVLPNFQVLQYAWKHMDRDWAKEVVRKSVKCVKQDCWESDIRRGVFLLHPLRGFMDSYPCYMLGIKHAARTLDWRVPLYLVMEMKMGRDKLDFLAQLADVRLARAAALAQCFYVAGKYVRQSRSGPWADVWSAMARCPAEIREKIASLAHLVLPPL